MRSSWEGREMLGKSRNLKVIRMSSPIVEILSGAAQVLHVARGPQRPYSENLKNPKFRKKNKKTKIGVRGSPERDILSLGALGPGPGGFPALFA